MGSSRWDHQNYRKTQKRLATLSSRTITTFEITFPMQNPSSNLCGLYSLFMAHYLKEIHFAKNVCTFFCKGRKSFTSKIQYFTNRSVSKLTTVWDNDIVRYFNKDCKCNFEYEVCYTHSNYDKKIFSATAITIEKIISFIGGRWKIIVTGTIPQVFVNIKINRL